MTTTTEKLPYTFTIKTIEVYKIRRINGRYGWADLTIDGWEGGGSINVQSDWGTYAYQWTSIGERSFKEFLLGLNYSYFMGKCIGYHGEKFSSSKTIEAIKRDIFKARRDDEIDSVVARDYYDAIDTDYDNISQDLFFERLWHTSIISEIYCSDPHSIPVVHEENHKARAFWDEVWPKFCEIIKGEEDGL